MANREMPDAAEHETFPGPGPLRADEAKRGIHPVEQMVDAAIDRIAREQQAARDGRPREVSAQEALALVSSEGASTSLAAAAAAASASTGSARRANARLRWKGLEVSEEFRSYADRVARGEDLPPFKGKILAEPDAEFPWDPKAQRRAEGRALKRQFGLWSGVALFLGLSVWVLIVQVGNQPDLPRASSSGVSTSVLSNQPAVQRRAAPVAATQLSATSGAEPKQELVPAPEPPPALPQVQPEAPGEATVAAAAAPPSAGATAFASLQERAGVAAAGGRAPVAPPAAASTPGARPSAGTTPTPAAASRAAVGAATAAAPAVGVFVATRPGSASPTVPSASDPAPTPVIASEAAPGSSGQVAPAAPGAAPPAGAANTGGPETAAAEHADPKKETGREASGMGPLLVETPSF
ncbi:MAG TPA: hypothetical protein VFS67_08010 [Polyangiaceae bacterium]|nr:hypothetical protein [Polyangiaceae bacterium]